MIEVGAEKTTPCDQFIVEGECACPTIHYPPPGSRWAIDAGCTCPVIDNEYGRGYHYTPDRVREYVMNMTCPVHGEERWLNE